MLRSETSQKDVHERVGIPFVDSILQGFNATIFAYGQTGSGKTYTMYGEDSSDIWNTEEIDSRGGLVPRIVNTLFDRIDPDGCARTDDGDDVELTSYESTRDDASTGSIYFTIKCTFLEIYNNNVRDLLVHGTSTEKPRARHLNVRETTSKGVWVEGATEVFVTSASDVAKLVKRGLQHRTVAMTKMNDYSSRSHCIFTVHLHQSGFADGTTRTSRLNLVDLAGSERVQRTGVLNQKKEKGRATLREARNINQSLSCLGTCIFALTDSNRSHIPYRDSKLTHMLKESLGGNARTCLLTTVSPMLDDFTETLNTLRFGSIARVVQIHARVNVQKSTEQLQLELDATRKLVATLEEENASLRTLTDDREKYTEGRKDVERTNKGSDRDDEDPRFVALQSTLSLVLTKMAFLQSRLNDSEKLRQSIKSELETLQNVIEEDKRDSSVQELSKAWIRLREHEMSVKNHEAKVESDRAELQSQFDELREAQRKMKTSETLSTENREKDSVVVDDVSSDLHISDTNKVKSDGDESVGESLDDAHNAMNEEYPASTSRHGGAFHHTALSSQVEVKDTPKDIDFDTLWKLATQNAELSFLMEGNATLRRRPQSAYCQARKLSEALRIKRHDIQDKLKALESTSCTLSPVDENGKNKRRTKIVRIAGSRKIAVREDDNRRASLA